ncbi:MAG: nucleoside monophosphate kinase [Firmicutes bacterium]|nr:nucleoside monophosphate kinase [Bacillota bacterium]
MRNIIFIAPPAAGKGTVSDYLVKNYNYIHLSTGDLLREEIKSGSTLGQEIDKIISGGNLVSDELIIKLVEDKLNTLDKNKPFILDGFPRTLVQTEKLEEMLITLGVTNNLVVYLDINLEDATKRVIGRIVCPKCKRSYNLYDEKVKPLKDNTCDDCIIELEKRSDDNEETFKVRFNSYLENTSPIINYYKDKGLLLSVDAMSGLDNMLEVIVKEAKND